jgi:hypothetical protein
MASRGEGEDDGVLRDEGNPMVVMVRSIVSR